MHSSFPTTPTSLHIAVDFGSAGLDIAYAINNEVYIQKKWNSISKPQCIVLFDPRKQLDSFGIDAKHKYYSLSSKKKKTWMLFEQFKIALFATKRSRTRTRTRSTIKIKQELTASNGLMMSSEQVFIAVFAYIYDNCMKWLQDKRIMIEDKRNIEWLIAIPSILNQEANDSMQIWAQKAGLNKVHIIDESNCGASSILHLKEKEATFAKEDKYILVDAGADTVDITAHQILSEFEVTTICPQLGDMFGSSGINKKFTELLNKMFGKKTMEKYKTKCFTNYTQLMSNFNAAKHECFRQKKAKHHNVKLGAQFVKHTKKKTGRKKNMFSDNDSREAYVENDDLVMNIALWQYLFDEVQGKILRGIKKLLHKDIARDCKYLYIIGGLSSSPYFQQKVEEEFGRNTRYKLRVIAPSHPMSCVVEGACYAAITNNFIKARKLNKTYGVRVNLPLTTALKQGVPQEHIANNLVFNQETKKCHVRNCFEIIAAKGEEISTNVVKKLKSKRLNLRQQAILKYILCSDLKEPKVVADGDKLGAIKLEFDDDVKDLVINTEFHFDDTKLKVFVYPKSRPNLRKEVQLSYS